MDIKNKPSIIFMGSSEFAVATLDAVHKEFGVQAVVTIPDKPQGRGLKVLPSPVKVRAIENGLPLYQPVSLKESDFLNILSSYNPDIILVIAFRILPREVYKMPKIASFNIHASLLPKYRGAAPINWAVINGETETGLTSFILEDKVDTGNVLLRKRVEIPENSTAGDMHDILFPLAADMAIETTNLLLKGDYTPLPQDESLACPAPKLYRNQCQINWLQSSETIRNFINGTSPVPGAWTIFDGKQFKILRAEHNPNTKGNTAEYIIEDKKMSVFCNEGCVSLLEVQVEGKKPVKIDDFIRGYRGNKKGIMG